MSSVHTGIENGTRLYVVRAIQKGLLLFITSNGSIKICPPLVISEDALIEGLDTLAEALDECVSEEAK